jgi:hypothetical protein
VEPSGTCPIDRRCGPSRIVATALSLFLCSGCQQASLNILINRSDASLIVRYAEEPVITIPGAAGVCALAQAPPQIRLASKSGAWPAREWMPASDYRFDSTNCEIQVILPAGYALLIKLNGWCSDYRRRRDAGSVPTLRHVVIESRGHTHRWTGWDTATRFERNASGSCIFDFRG